ncbi:MAG: KEOPS complex subunit Pcc1 [Candidatus Thermoplasmatota archaeon]
MKVECKLGLDFKNHDEAMNVYRSVKVDDFDFVDSNVEDSCLKAVLKSNSISSFLHTLDDYLSCISVAEKIVDKD